MCRRYELFQACPTFCVTSNVSSPETYILVLFYFLVNTLLMANVTRRSSAVSLTIFAAIVLSLESLIEIFFL